MKGGVFGFHALCVPAVLGGCRHNLCRNASHKDTFSPHKFMFLAHKDMFLPHKCMFLHNKNMFVPEKDMFPVNINKI